jgi:hypothetical protein
MADLTTADLAWVRSKIGSGDPPSDADLHAAYERLGTRELVATEVLEGRLASILSGPQKLSLEGDITIDYGAAAKGISGLIDGIRSPTGTGLLYRTDRER